MEYKSQKHYQDVQEYFSATDHLPELPYIETMVTHGCTLSCEGCTNYSDYGMSGGNVSWEEHFEDLKVLTNRFRMDVMDLLVASHLCTTSLKTGL